MGEDMPAPCARRRRRCKEEKVNDAVPGHRHRTMTFRSVARRSVIPSPSSTANVGHSASNRDDDGSELSRGPEGQAKYKARVMTSLSLNADGSRANTSVICSGDRDSSSPLKPLDLMNALKGVTRSGDNIGAGRGQADTVDPALVPFEKMKKMRLPEGIR